MQPTVSGDAPSRTSDVGKLDVDLCDALAQEHGVRTVKEQAAYFGISRGYMFRLRNHEQTPSLPLGLKMARQLCVSPYRLFGYDDRTLA